MSLSPLGTPAVPACPQLFDLERRRQERVAQLATLIQKTFRGWRCRTQYQLMRKSQILISAWFRGHRVRKGGPSALLPPQTGLPQLTPPLPTAAKEQVRADEALGAAHPGVRAGLEGEGWTRRGLRGRRGSRGGTRLIPSPRVPSFPPASLAPSRSVCVSLSPPRAPTSPAGSSGS